MQRIRPLLLAFAGLCLPLGLALAVYLTSARSLAAPPPIGLVPTQIAKASPKAPTTTAKEREDRSGNCDEAEHASDPECTGGTTTSGGGSSGSDDSSGSGSSGSGSDDSSGSGSSGSSGSGSEGSGSDSSGSGSGDD